MIYKTLDDIDVKGKRVLLRSDLNSELHNGKAVLSDRIIESAKTINELKRRGAKVIVVAHQGRKGEKDFTSLISHSKLLNKYAKIKFVDDVIGKKADEAINSLKNGEAILLENIRKIDDEVNLGRKNKIVDFFKGKIDFYVNDAFSVCHREHASVVLLPKLVEERAVGRLVERELKHLDKIRGKKCLFILGGNKTDNALLLGGGRKVLTTGAFANLCLMAKGYDLGISNTKFLGDKIKIIKEMKSKLKDVKTPIDVALKVNGKRMEQLVWDAPFKYQILDIGHATVEEYIHRIEKADAIFMKGTAGLCEDKNFCYATFRLLKAIASAKGHKVLSGGHLSTALRKFDISKNRFDYVSLSGGATVNYIIGKKLVGLEALKK